MAITAAPQAIKASPSGLLDYYWIMFYKHGMGGVMTKGFYHKGTRMDAQGRAQRHCEVMKYKLLLVRPLASDLDEDEGIKLTAREGEIIP